MNAKNIDVWLVDDDASIRWVLEQSLRDAGMKPTSFEGAAKFLRALKNRRPDVVITDIRMPGMSGLELLSELQQSDPDLPVIVTTAHSDLDHAVDSYQAGAFEYLPKPFDIDEAVDLVRRAARRVVRAPESVSSTMQLSNIIGKAPAMQEVYRAIGRLSKSAMTVLITGESGTGKELIANALHEHSPRHRAPFVALNTSAIPAELLESELFGHEKGAFTGADRQRVGRFEQANGGTLFLDEIGDMPAPLQTRLLRVLAEGEFYRVGGQMPINVDTRVIAATHQDLDALVASGDFREDLYHRLNVIQIEAPPLRKRREDIDALMTHYLAEAAREIGVPPKALTANAKTVLMNLEWPGNVRQLVNVCRRLTALAPGREIRVHDIPKDLGSGAPVDQTDWSMHLARWAAHHLETTTTPLLNNAVPIFEKTLIRAALAKTRGKRQQAARLLGWGRNTLTRKIKELDM
ncbi:MAG: nitrogen regulation protein NR(I) [Gammaproteobacteria bacterium]